MSIVATIPSTVVGKIQPIAKHICRKVGPKAPELLLGLGITAVGTGTVMACVRSAKRTPQIISDANDLAESVRESNADDEKAMRRGVAHTYIHMGYEMTKVYALPTAIIGAGVGCIIGSHHIQKSRIVAIGAAYNTLLASFNEYRARVVEKEGETADKKYLYGEHEETIVEQKVSKKGKVTEKEKKIQVLGSGDGESLYHRRFDMTSSSQWTNDPDYNLAFVKGLERIFNNQLQAQGYVFLDEVYQSLGFSLDGYSNAKNVGWLLGEGDNHIDFGLYHPDMDLEERATNLAALRDGNDYKRTADSDIFMNGYDNALWLDFNCDGVIIDRI